MSFKAWIRNTWETKGGAILTGVGVVTGVAAVVTAAWQTPKAQRAINDKENDRYMDHCINGNGADYVPMTTWERIKVGAKYYILPVSLEIVSVACNIGAEIKGEYRLAAANTALNALATSSEIFKDVVKSNVSKDKFEKIQNIAANREAQVRQLTIPNDYPDDGMFTFVEPITGVPFRGKAEMVNKGLLEFNQLMMRSDKATLSDLMMCWMNEGVTGLTLSPTSDIWIWRAEHDKDWVDIKFSYLSNNYANPIAYINYNRDPKWDEGRRN